jgi:protein phosphatase
MAGAESLDCYGLNDPGKVRPTNEDQFLVAELQKSVFILQTSLPHEDCTRVVGRVQGRLLLVADGMGGRPAGARASRIAIRSVLRYILNTMPWFFRLDEQLADELRDELAAAVRESQRDIEGVVAEHPEYGGMGTTFTMAYVLPRRAYVVHAGDSRCYLFRGGTLRQLTSDHNVAQQMVRDGLLDPDQAADTAWSDLLWNVVGGRSGDLKPEVRRVALQAGDVLLLCTDGLTKHVDDAAIARTLGAGWTAEAVCRHLVGAANAAGGTDNITVVVSRIVPPAPSAPPARDAAATVPRGADDGWVATVSGVAPPAPARGSGGSRSS